MPKSFSSSFGKPRIFLAGVFAFVHLFSNSAFALWGEDEKPPEKLSLATPLISILIPGLPQALENRSLSAATFAGQGLLGLSLYLSVPAGNLNSKPISAHEYLDRTNIRNVGGSVLIHASFLGGYESFMHRVQNHQEEGRYQFIKDKNTMPKILMSPFDFSHLKKSTTWIPFLTAMVLGAGSLGKNQSDKGSPITLQGGDLLASGVLSYNAGTGEEAFFRGYLYPVFYQNMSEPWMAQATQSLIFGAAHANKVQYPVFQTVFGYYLGWLTEKNDFNLEESIFIHVWWDFWVISASLIADRSNAHGSKVLYLPMISFKF